MNNPAKKIKLENENGVMHFNEPEKKDFINLLPHEYLANIFTYCPAEQRLELNSGNAFLFYFSFEEKNYFTH